MWGNVDYLPGGVPNVDVILVHEDLACFNIDVKAVPLAALDEHVAAVLDSPAACRNVLRQLRARHRNGELNDAKWSSVSDELERLRTPPDRRPEGWYRGSR